MGDAKQDIDYLKSLISSLRDIDRDVWVDAENRLGCLLTEFYYLKRRNEELKEELDHLKNSHNTTTNIENHKSTETEMIKLIDDKISLLQSMRQDITNRIIEDFVDGIK